MISNSQSLYPWYFDLFYLPNAQGTATPDANALRAARADDTALDPVEHRLHRAGVGKLQHLVPIRNELAFSVKELARYLANPAQHSLAKLRHLIRYIKTTGHDELERCPAIKLESRESAFDIVTWVNSGWAGCVCDWVRITSYNKLAFAIKRS